MLDLFIIHHNGARAGLRGLSFSSHSYLFVELSEMPMAGAGPAEDEEPAASKDTRQTTNSEGEAAEESVESGQRVVR